MFKEHRLYARWSDGRNSVKINSSSIKTPHAHFQYVHIRFARFKKDPLKTIRVVDYTNSIPVKCDERTDRQTDGQTGANLNAPDYRHGGIKRQCRGTQSLVELLDICQSLAIFLPPFTCLTCKTLTFLSLMILFEGNRESKSWLIISTLLAHPDPFLPPPPLLHYTHILAIFPSLNNTSRVVDGGIFTCLKMQEETHVPVPAYLDRLEGAQ